MFSRTPWPIGTMRQTPIWSKNTPSKERSPWALVGILALLVVPIFLSATPAQAQITIGIGDRRDHTYGWNFPELTSASLSMEDAAGDLIVQAGPAESPPINPAAVQQEADLVGLHVYESDDTVVLLRIVVASLDAGAHLRENWLEKPTYRVTFSIQGVLHRLTMDLALACADAEAPVCDVATAPRLVASGILARFEDSAGWTNVGLPATRVVEADNAIDVLLPRYALLRPGQGRGPLAGDSLSDLHVSSQMGMQLFPGLTGAINFTLADSLPDDGPLMDAYAFQLDSAGALVSLRMFQGGDEAGEADVQGVGIGTRAEPLRPRSQLADLSEHGARKIPLEVVNRLRRGALVVPTVDLINPPAGLTAHVVESLSVPATDSRRFDIQFRGNATIDPATPMRVAVAIETLGTGSTYADRLELLVRSMPSLGPAQPNLYLHTYGEDTLGEMLPTTMLRYSQGALSTLADDPIDNGAGATLSWGCLCSDNVFDWNMLSGLGDTLYVDSDEPVVLHLSITAPIEGYLELEGALAHGTEPLGHAREGFTLVQGTNEILFALPVPEEVNELRPSGDPISLSLYGGFRPGGDIPLAELTNLVHPLDAHLEVGGASWIELPLIDRTQRYADLEHIALDLARGNDAVQYVNPGRSILWNLNILNQGDSADTVTIRATVDQADWSTTVRPAARYKLAPGDSITVGIQLRAPSDVAEATAALVNVTLASQLAKGNTAGIIVTGVSTSGVEIADRSYVTDNETEARIALDDENRGSPGPGFGLLLAGIGLLGLGGQTVRRRRR